MVLKTVRTNDALLKLFSEAIDNAVDNTLRKPSTTHIRVSMDATSIIVENDGAHIPIKQQDGEWIPTTVFAKQFSGSNFDDETGREGAGMNGLGITLCAGLSDEFSIQILDPELGLKLVQTWTNRLGSTTGPKITKKKSKHKNMTTTVKFSPTLSRFKEQSLEPFHEQVLTRLVQIAATCDVKITFNGQMIKTNNFKKYIASFGSFKKFMHDRLSPTFEFGVALSDGEFKHQSFVNNLCTADGGTHVKVVESQVVDTLLNYFKKKFKGPKLTRHNIRQKLFVFVNMTKLRNPTFKSQSKVFLTTPIPKTIFKIDPKKILANCKRIGLLDQLEELLMSKDDKAMADAMNGSKKKSISVPKLIDASYAGGVHSKDCSLFLTEGDSARTFVVSGLGKIGPKTHGVFPLRGKLLNCYSASNAQIIANKEITNIVKILGLSKNSSTLRYGKVVILTDADCDGFHIMGLILAYFQKFFPELLKNGFIQRMITPVIVATKRSEKHEFFSVPDFNRWFVGKSGYKIRYLKGLGSSTREEAVGYFTNIQNYLKNISINDMGVQQIDLFFNDKRAGDRKEWLTQTDDMDLDYESQEQSVGRFIDTELKQFSQETLTRAIPSLVDGLKESQRKILFACFKKFDSANQPFKIAQLASYTAEKTAYLHGETSLGGAITKMTQGFVGSNNLPLLVPEGQTGSRLQMGADAASTRYTFTKLQPYTRHIFHPDDDAILTYRTEEGQSIEPDHFVPIVPMVLVNGASGIAVGYRTEIPQHNLQDIIKSILHKINHGTFLDIKPFYEQFRGTITETEDAWLTHGAFTQNGNKIEITEIPIGVSTDKYTEYLSKLQDGGKIVRFASSAPDENSVNFVLHVPPTFDPACLKLTKTVTKRCLNLLFPSGTIRTFATINEILVEFYIIRLVAYAKRRRHLIQSYTEQLSYIDAKIKFVKAVLANKIRVRDSKADILSQALREGISKKLCEEFLKMSILSLSAEKVAKMEEEQKQLRVVLDKTKNTSPEQFYRADLKELRKTKKRKRSDGI